MTRANTKSSSVSGPRKLSKFLLEGVMDSANSGPMPAKKELKPSAISSAPVIVFPFCLKKEYFPYAFWFQ